MPEDLMTSEAERMQEDSIFIRYAGGFILKIEPNIQESVAGITSILREDIDYRTVLRRQIRTTSYGGAYGDVAKESTWVAATLELFERFRRYSHDEILAERTRETLVELVILLSSYQESIEWDRVRQFIVDHIEELCPLSPLHMELDGQVLIRDENGYFYINENNERVEVRGMMTPPEQALQAYTNDIQEPYGRLYHLLRYIALFEIAYQYRTHRSDFPDDLSCALYDNNGDTHYLGWQWRRPTPFEYVAYKWHPRSPFSNPEWLGSDLIMHLDLPSGHPDQPQLSFEPTHEALSQWNEVFGSSSLQLELPVSTNLLIGTEPEVYLDFMDKKIRWVNGDLFLEPILVIPTNNERGEDAIELARKFLSVINYEHTVELSERWISIQPTRYVPMVKQPRMTVFHLVRPDYAITNNYQRFSQQKWNALAFMREAENARSIFYSFLNYYKIIEMVYGKDGAREWINDNAERVCDEKGIDWYEKYIAPIQNKKAGVHLAGTMRNAVAHGVYRNQGQVTHNPDSPQDYNATQRDLRIIEALAKDVVGTLT